MNNTEACRYKEKGEQGMNCQANEMRKLKFKW